MGNELLNGIRVNGHLEYIGRQLANYGVELQRNMSFPDEPELIRRYFLDSFENSDVVMTTGGLGPTTDDNTREVIADCLGLKLEFVPEIKEAIRKRFERMQRTMSDSNLKQCYLPEGAEILINFYGTAPGIWLKHEGKLVIMLPGPASELYPMFQEQVLKRLDAEGYLQGREKYLQLRTIGVGESALQEKLTPVFERHEGLGVAYCAHQGIVDFRLSRGATELTDSQIQELGDECADILQGDFICFGDKSLAKVVFDHLRADEKSLAVAESCTGGLLSNSFTDLPGASKVFAGGVVCYNNDAKMELLDVPEGIILQHGAVSKETAAAMATGAMEKFSADYALSVTGFAGPSGGTTRNPIGTIYIGYSSPSGVWSIRMVHPGERIAVKTRAVNRALDVIRRKLKEFKVEDAIQSMLSTPREQFN